MKRFRARSLALRCIGGKCLGMHLEKTPGLLDDVRFRHMMLLAEILKTLPGTPSFVLRPFDLSMALCRSLRGVFCLSRTKE